MVATPPARAHKGPGPQLPPRPLAPVPETSGVPPLAVLGAVLGCLAPIVLGMLFASAYDALDRREPSEEAARQLHWSVVGVAAFTIAAGVLIALRTKPPLALGLVLFPLGFALASMATTYSQTECVTGFWTADCDTWGDQRGTFRMWTWLGFLATAGGGALMLLAGRDWGFGFPLAMGLGLAAAYLTASITLLPRLSEEAAKAAESNEPLVHQTPGLGLALLALTMLALAVGLRRRT